MTIKERRSGVLLPLFSLPGPESSGTLGESAKAFCRFLSRAGQTWWQMLPINPIDAFYSPYSSVSAMAGEPLYIDPGDLDVSDWPDRRSDALPDTGSTAGPSPGPNEGSGVESGRVDYERARKERFPIYRRAFEEFSSGRGCQRYRAREEQFREENRFWLDDYALFQAFAHRFGTKDWSRWPEEFRRHDQALKQLLDAPLEESVRFNRFLQLVFDFQWKEFHEYSHELGINLLGDVPIYVGAASADTWSHPELFQMDKDGHLDRVAGVPGDDFNPDGQRWDSPLYDWEEHRRTGFQWWLQRIGHTLSRFDAVRLDHFIGFYNYYSFPSVSGEKETAVGDRDLADPACSGNEIPVRDGKTDWIPGPREEFLDILFSQFSRERFIAEDLGVMNKGVHDLRDHYELPGMNVLQFSFDSDERTDPARMWRENSIACTGTHDTPPVLSWLTELDLAGPEAWPSFARVWHVLLNYQRDEEKVVMDFSRNPERYGKSWEYWQYSSPLVAGESRPVRADIIALRKAVLRMVMNSSSEVALFPIQDLLGLGKDARTNFPGHCEGNWQWRMRSDQMTVLLADELRELTIEGHRAREER